MSFSSFKVEGTPWKVLVFICKKYNSRVALGIDHSIMPASSFVTSLSAAKPFPVPILSSASGLRNMMICCQENTHKNIPGCLTFLRTPQLNAGLCREETSPPGCTVVLREPVPTPGKMKIVFKPNNPHLRIIRQVPLSERYCHSLGLSNSWNPVPYLSSFCLSCKFFLTLTDFMTTVAFASFCIQDHRLPKSAGSPGLQTYSVILLLDCHQSYAPDLPYCFPNLSSNSQ